jgi:ribosome biogenesis GTPase
VIDLVSWGLDPRTARAFEALGRSDLLLARVVAAPGGRWRAVTAHGETLVEPAGRLRFEAESAADLPAVGDWLAVASRPGEARAMAIAVLPRRTALVRKAAGRAVAPQVLAANVDHVLVACGLDLDWNPARLERYLAVAWESGAQPVVVLTKADLAEDLAARVAEAEALAVGAPVVAVSARTGAGADALAALLPSTSTSALVGSSGVGKSTLVNRLAGREAQATSDVRAHDGRGRHTTTTREMFALPWGALVIDTPGLRELAVWTDGEAVERAFDDVLAFAAGCRFRDCSHGPEPGCAVTDAVARGVLPAARLDDYRHLRREQAFLARKDDVHLMRAERARWKAIGKAGRAAMDRKRSWGP